MSSPDVDIKIPEEEEKVTKGRLRSAEEQVLTNPLLVPLILPHCSTDPAILRAVHPLWNDTILSCAEPRLLLSIPIYTSYRACRHDRGEPYVLSMDIIDGADLRLGRWLYLDEHEPYYEDDVDDDGIYRRTEWGLEFHAEPLSHILALTTYAQHFRENVERLSLVINHPTTLHYVVFLLTTNCCPNLKCLGIEFKPEEDGTAEWKNGMLPMSYKAKQKLEYLSVVTPCKCQRWEDTKFMSTVVRTISKISPNLRRILLESNVFPSFEVEGREIRPTLKQLIWRTRFGGDDAGLLCDHSDPRNIYSEAACFKKFRKRAGLFCGSLEVLELYFSGCCEECRRSIEESPVLDKCLFPNLHLLIIQNPYHFMLEDAAGFDYFASRYMPNLRTLQFSGHPEFFANLNAKLQAFLRRNAGQIRAETANLGSVSFATCNILGQSKTFPNLRTLTVSLVPFTRGVPISPTKIVNGGGARLKKTLDHLGSLPTLEELKIRLRFTIPQSGLIQALNDTKLFESDVLRKFTLSKAEEAVVETDIGMELYPRYVELLVEALRKTNRLTLVILTNLGFPQEIINPVMRAVKVEKLPVFVREKVERLEENDLPDGGPEESTEEI